MSVKLALKSSCNYCAFVKVYMCHSPYKRIGLDRQHGSAVVFLVFTISVGSTSFEKKDGLQIASSYLNVWLVNRISVSCALSTVRRSAMNAVSAASLCR